MSLRAYKLLVYKLLAGQSPFAAPLAERLSQAQSV